MIPLGGVPLVERVILRAERLGFPVALATSDRSEDDALADFVESLGFPVVRGELDDVLHRSVHAADTLGWDYFFRLCGDRPFFDIEDMRRIHNRWTDALGGGGFDLATTLSSRLPKGLTTEFVNSRTLAEMADRVDVESAHREHVTSFLYEHGEAYRIVRMSSRFEMDRRICLAVDTPEDLRALSAVCDADPDIHIQTDRAISILISQTACT